MIRSILTLMFSVFLLSAPALAQGKIIGCLKNPLKCAKKLAKGLKGKTGAPNSLDGYALRDGVIVLGEEPSFLAEKCECEKYPYNLLSDLVVGEYDLNPLSGAPRSAKALWMHHTAKRLVGNEQVSIIEKARAENPRIRILLNIVAYGDFGPEDPNERAKYYRQFFSSAECQKTVCDSLERIFQVWSNEPYLLDAESTGIVLDFQLLPKWEGREEDIKKFVRYLHDYFVSRENGQPLLYLKLPYYIEHETPLFSKLEDLNNVVDLYILQGNWFPELFYNNGHAGLEDTAQNLIRHSLAYYVDSARMVHADRSKMIVQYPLYGLSFQQPPGSPGPELNKSQPLVPYFAIRSKKGLKESYTPAGFTKAQDPPEMQNAQTYYYLDSVSYGRQYQWIGTEQLAGAGFYGLGYMKGAQMPVWGAVAAAYGYKPLGMGWAVAGFMFLLAFFGFPYSVYKYWETRNILAKYTKYLLWSGLVALLFLLIALIAVDIIPKTKAGATFVFVVLGFFVLVILLRKYIAQLNRYLGFIGIKQKVQLKKLP